MELLDDDPPPWQAQMDELRVNGFTVMTGYEYTVGNCYFDTIALFFGCGLTDSLSVELRQIGCLELFTTINGIKAGDQDNEKVKAALITLCDLLENQRSLKAYLEKMVRSADKGGSWADKAIVQWTAIGLGINYEVIGGSDMRPLLPAPTGAATLKLFYTPGHYQPVIPSNLLRPPPLPRPKPPTVPSSWAMESSDEIKAVVKSFVDTRYPAMVELMRDRQSVRILNFINNGKEILPPRRTKKQSVKQAPASLTDQPAPIVDGEQERANDEAGPSSKPPQASPPSLVEKKKLTHTAYKAQAENLVNDFLNKVEVLKTRAPEPFANISVMLSMVISYRDDKSILHAAHSFSAFDDDTKPFFSDRQGFAALKLDNAKDMLKTCHRDKLRGVEDNQVERERDKDPIRLPSKVDFSMAWSVKRTWVRENIVKAINHDCGLTLTTRDLYSKLKAGEISSQWLSSFWPQDVLLTSDSIVGANFNSVFEKLRDKIYEIEVEENDKAMPAL